MQDYVQKLLYITRYGYKLELKKIPASGFLDELTEQAERLFTAGKTSFHKSFKNNAQYFMADKGELVPGNSARTGGAEVLVKLPLNITASPSGPLPTQNNFQLY